MKIGLFIHPYSKTAPGGLGRANALLSEALIQVDAADSFTLYTKQGRGPLWLTGGQRLDSTLDAYVFFTPLIPLFFTPKKSIVIVHDLAYRSMKPRSLKEYATYLVLGFLHARSLRIATRIAAVSQATKDDIIRQFGIAAEKITVVPIGFMPLPETGTPLEVPEKFILFAGVLKERKNVSGVIRAFTRFHEAQPGFKLLIAGATSGTYYRSLVKLVESLSLTNAVQFTGYVTNEELSYLYAKARAFVFPSLLEGFGMPVLEAMHAGTPVVTSNLGALAEVAGNAAVLVDPNDSESIANGIARAALDSVERDDLIRRGRARAAEFSWEKAGTALALLLKR